jgi:hypothetical protein
MRVIDRAIQLISAAALWGISSDKYKKAEEDLRCEFKVQEVAPKPKFVPGCHVRVTKGFYCSFGFEIAAGSLGTMISDRQCIYGEKDLVEVNFSERGLTMWVDIANIDLVLNRPKFAVGAKVVLTERNGNFAKGSVGEVLEVGKHAGCYYVNFPGLGAAWVFVRRLRSYFDEPVSEPTENVVTLKHDLSVAIAQRDGARIGRDAERRAREELALERNKLNEELLKVRGELKASRADTEYNIGRFDACEKRLKEARDERDAARTVCSSLREEFVEKSKTLQALQTSGAEVHRIYAAERNKLQSEVQQYRSSLSHRTEQLRTCEKQLSEEKAASNRVTEQLCAKAAEVMNLEKELRDERDTGNEEMISKYWGLNT